MRARIVERLRRFPRSEDGATAIEYAFIATFVAAAIVGAVTAMGTNVAALFDQVAAGFPT